MNRNQRRMAAYNTKKASEAIEQTRFKRRIVSTLSSCNQRVEKACSSPSLRDRRQPGINLTNTKYQRVENEAGRQIHAVQKVRGKSIPPI